MNNGYKVRKAGFEDAQGIFQIIREYPEELLARPISDIVQNIDRFLVAECDKRVVGTVSWQILPEIGLAKDPAVELKSLAVGREYRGRGIGAALADAAISKILKMHPLRIVVLTFSPEFFRKRGFSEVRKEELMHKLYMGCINCSKYDSPFTCPEVAMSLDAGRASQGGNGTNGRRNK